VKSGRRFVVRGRRRYAICRTRARAKRCSDVARSCERAVARFAVTTFVLVVLVVALAAAGSGLLPHDRPDGAPIASLAHYSFDDFANAQR